MFGGRKENGRKEVERKEIEWICIFYKYVCLDTRKMKGMEIEKELFSIICLCGKVKGKKEIMLLSDNFTLILL